MHVYEVAPMALPPPREAHLAHPSPALLHQGPADIHTQSASPERLRRRNHNPPVSRSQVDSLVRLQGGQRKHLRYDVLRDGNERFCGSHVISAKVSLVPLISLAWRTSCGSLG